MVALSWTGFYLGLNGGGAWSHNCWQIKSVFGTPIAPPVDEGCSNASGGIVGGQLGYRWQMASWVFGVEAQGDWANLKGSNLSTPFAGLVTNQTKTDAIGLFTGQVGDGSTGVRLYVKGGAPVTHG